MLSQTEVICSNLEQHRQKTLAQLFWDISAEKDIQAVTKTENMLVNVNTQTTKLLKHCSKCEEWKC